MSLITSVKYTSSHPKWNSNWMSRPRWRSSRDPVYMNTAGPACSYMQLQLHGGKWSGGSCIYIVQSEKQGNLFRMMANWLWSVTRSRLFGIQYRLRVGLCLLSKRGYGYMFMKYHGHALEIRNERDSSQCDVSKSACAVCAPIKHRHTDIWCDAIVVIVFFLQKDCDARIAYMTARVGISVILPSRLLGADALDGYGLSLITSAHGVPLHVCSLWYLLNYQLRHFHMEMTSRTIMYRDVIYRVGISHLISSYIDAHSVCAKSLPVYMYWYCTEPS